MLCSNCRAETNGVCENGYVWCTSCGCVLTSSQIFVSSYEQSYACRTVCYSRRKRFSEYVKKNASSISLQQFHEILDLYSNLEFCWTSSKTKSGRTYFFARPVMLLFCCDLLKMNVKNLPRLKDKNREHIQYGDLHKIAHGEFWNNVYGDLENKCYTNSLAPNVTH